MMIHLNQEGETWGEIIITGKSMYQKLCISMYYLKFTYNTGAQADVSIRAQIRLE